MVFVVFVTLLLIFCYFYLLIRDKFYETRQRGGSYLF